MTQTKCCNRRRRGAAIALGAMLALAAPTLADANDGRPGTPAQRKACTPDVYRLCAGEIPSVAKITSCLRRKKDSLSAACRAVFEQ